MTRTTSTSAMAVAADYADAILVARRAKNWLFLLLLLILLVQMGVFAVARFVPGIHIVTTIRSGAPGAVAATQTSEMPVLQRSADGQRLLSPVLQELVDWTDLLGVVFAVVLSVVLWLILTIMLVGRLVGVTHVMSSFVWCVVLLVLLFPWQTLLNSHGTWIRFTHDVSGNHPGDVVELDANAANAFFAAGVAERAGSYPTPDVRVPGILYTWGELVRDYDFSNADLKFALIKWARFAGFPVVAMIILMSVQARSSRGLRFALGEAEVQVEVNSPAV